MNKDDAHTGEKQHATGKTNAIYTQTRISDSPAPVEVEYCLGINHQTSVQSRLEI